VVRHTLTGSEVHSNIERPATHRSVLDREGMRILLLKLHGYIFFATAIGLVRKITDRLSGAERPLEYLIFDFQHVTGLDTSALHGFVKLRQRAVENGVRILLSHMPAQIHDQFEREGFYSSDGVVDQRFTDMDHALEWSEARILEAQGLEARPDEHPLDHQLHEIFDTADEQKRFRVYLQRLEIPKDEFLFREHEKSPAIYFIESGELSEYLDREDTKSFRLRCVGAGSLLGAAAFFRRGGTEEMVSVRADTPSVAYALSINAVERMAKEDPQLLLELQSYVLHFLSERLAANLDLLRGLLMVEE
jgi:SulP family sulfate permease